LNLINEIEEKLQNFTTKALKEKGTSLDHGFWGPMFKEVVYTNLSGPGKAPPGPYSKANFVFFQGKTFDC
jgi:hypothetical protein